MSLEWFTAKGTQGDLSLMSLEWFASNKDALVAMAALVSPVVAVIGTLVAAFVSYRAVITGPRIQREIAKEQFSFTSKQVALQERTLALTEAQISANLLGAADHKWIDDFVATVAELDGCLSELGVILSTQQVTSDPAFKVTRAIDLGDQIPPLLAKIELMVGATYEQLPRLFRQWFIDIRDDTKRTTLRSQAFKQAESIIEQKRSGITARLIAIDRKAEAIAAAGLEAG